MTTPSFDIEFEIRRWGVLFEHVEDSVKLNAEQYDDIKNALTVLKVDVGGLKDQMVKFAIEMEFIQKTLDSHTKTLSSHTEMIGQLAMDMTMVKMDITMMKEDITIMKC